MEDTHVDVLNFRKFRAGGGPLRSLQKYLRQHPDFEPATDVEPYVTTNFFGYWIRSPRRNDAELQSHHSLLPHTGDHADRAALDLPFQRERSGVIVVDNAPGCEESKMLGEYPRIDGLTSAEPQGFLRKLPRD